MKKLLLMLFALTGIFISGGGVQAVNPISFNINADVDSGPVQTDVLNVTVSSISGNIDLAEYLFSDNDICDGNDFNGVQFWSDQNFSITGDNAFYLCLYARDSSANERYQLAGKLNVDNSGPVIDSHGNENAEATGSNGATVVYTEPNAVDAVDGTFYATCLPSSGSFFSLGTTTVSCNATDVAGNHALETYFDVIVSDTTPPEITVLGDNPLTLNFGGTYIDPGVSASDIVDGNLSGSVSTNSSGVNMLSAGSYTVYYDVQDAAGNWAIQSTRDVNVQVSPSDQTTADMVNMAIAGIPFFNDAQSMLEAIGNIKAARGAYDALTPAQKLLVTNLSDLTNAEDQINIIFPDLLIYIDQQLLGGGIESNIETCSDIQDGCAGLYFEKPGFGKIFFPGVLDLTDFDTIMTLGSLQTGISFTNGEIRFDAKAGDAFKTLGGVLYMYGLTFETVPLIYVDGELAGGDDVDDIQYDPATGTLIFTALHFSTFSTQDSNNSDEEGEKAKIISWEASIIPGSGSCKEKLKLEIKGKHFDDDAEVKIGSREASSVDVKSSKKIVAKFCLEKLRKGNLPAKRNIWVINPDADEAKAKKKIDLNKLTYDLENAAFDSATAEGVKNIQQALVKLGYLSWQNVTGRYDSVTIEAVKAFQGKNGIPQTGFVGSLTRAALQKALD